MCAIFVGKVSKKVHRRGIVETKAWIGYHKGEDKPYLFMSEANKIKGPSIPILYCPWCEASLEKK